jgi:hypothetical protein
MLAETKPRVDKVLLDVPAVMTVGESLAIDASILQDEGHEVPVQWPMSADWSGARVVIDDGREKKGPASVLRFNPATKQLTAVNAGTATLKLTVNGEKVMAKVTVVAAALATLLRPVDPMGLTRWPSDPAAASDPSIATSGARGAGAAEGLPGH